MTPLGGLATSHSFRFNLRQPPPPLLLVLKKFFHVQQPIFWPVPVQNKLLTQWPLDGGSMGTTDANKDANGLRSNAKGSVFFFCGGPVIEDSLVEDSLIWMDGPFFACPTFGDVLLCNYIRSFWKIKWAKNIQKW